VSNPSQFNLERTLERRFLILVADDDDDDQMLVKQAISEVMECDVKSVYNGVEMLDYLKGTGKYEGKKSPQPDFILLDLNMPLLDGFGVLGKIRNEAALSEIPIYILSTSRADHDKKRTQELGARGFYTKPILYHQLKAIIDEISRKYMGSR
jgi:two-component system response regulator